MTKWERRIRRERQQKYRKLGQSPATILENHEVHSWQGRGMNSEIKLWLVRIILFAFGFCLGYLAVG